MNLHPALSNILCAAYAPCAEFKSACVEMRWNPGAGHVPRGFLGASGELTEVELVLVFAEPGDPHAGERHTGLNSAYEYATFAFRTGKDLFHRNVRKILDDCWPDTAFDQQMRRVWLTESVLCSAQTEGASIGRSASKACGQRYLLGQLALFPQALVVALGCKAEDRLSALGVKDFMKAYAVAPPGCNRREVAVSWKKIPIELDRRRRAAKSASTG